MTFTSSPSVASVRGSLTLSDVSLGYGGKPVVEAVSVVIPRATLLALVGPNGAGKSTLLKALAGLHRPSSGTIENDLTLGRPAYLPQHVTIEPSFPMRVLDFVAMGLWRDLGFCKPLTAHNAARARAALAEVGLDGLDRQRIGTLSGGQLRRALFARAALQDAPLLLLDEPFAGVDAVTAADLLHRIERWRSEGRTVIVALHDLDQVRAHFPQTLLLARRVIAWGPTGDVLDEPRLASAFGHRGSAHV